MRLIIILFSLLFTLFANDTPWSGKWDMYWLDGSVTMEFTQTGDTVTGHYYPYGGNFTGKVENNTLSGILHQKNAENTLTVTISPDQNSFFGTILGSEWINGHRIINEQRNNVAPYDLSTPYGTLLSFLRLGNSVRNGKHENLTHAIACLDMGEENAKLRAHERFLLAALFFDVVDEHTVFLRTLNRKEVAQGDSYKYTIVQQGTKHSMVLEFAKGQDGNWRIKIPSREILQESLALLLEARGQKEVNPKSYLKLESPRDTMRTFIEQINRWESGGKEYVVNTLNLSRVDAKVREWEAPILAQYLKQVLDRTQVIIYQEIPNDPNSELDYVYFNHPLGKIVISPFEVDGKIRWQFTPETLSTISELNEAMDNLPLKEGILKLDNTTYFFALRHEAKKISPWLINKLFFLEIWQWLAIGLIMFFALTVSQFFSTLTKRVLKYIHFTKDLNSEGMVLRYLRPMRLLTIGIIWSIGLVYIGIPEFLFVTLRLIGLLLITIGLTWLAYNIINLIMAALHHRTKQTDTDIDDILVSLIGSTLKIIVIIAGFFAGAEIFSVPYQTVVAGLGIGGLAFAIAAKDTIANFFGSAIILADRPFVQGDEVKIGPYFGTVTHVGIRSTRIRTLDDTEVIIPNGQISNDIIDNFSKREYRRIKSKFLLDNSTDKQTLNDLEREITIFLEKDKNVINIDILIGVQEYSMFGIEFGATFYDDAQNKVDYSMQQHRLLSDIATIIKESGVELVSVRDNMVN